MRRFLLVRSIFMAVAAVSAVCVSAHAGEVTVNEFGSAYYAQAYNYGLTPYGFPTTFPANRPDFTNFSLFGISVVGKYDDHWSAAGQLVGLGDSNTASNNSFSTFNIQASWAYAAYKDGDWTIRAGRQRFPVFTASEYIYEHYQLPFREMPSIVYQMAPFVAFDGASVSKDFAMDFGKFNFQVFGGTPILAIIPPGGVTTAQLTNLVGGRLNFEGDGYRLRVQASRSSSQSTLVSTGAISAQADSQYYSAGYRYDKNNIVSWGEFLFRQAPDGTITTSGRYLGRGMSGYWLGGYRIGDWMPRYTFAQAGAGLGTVGEGKTTTHTIGVNYQANAHAVVKVEYELDVVPTTGGGYKDTQPTNTSATSGSAAYAGVDFYF